MHLPSVRPSVRLFIRLFVCRSNGTWQQTSCCRFAAVSPAGRKYRSTVARRTTARRAAGECGYCHVVSVRRELKIDSFY